MLKIVKETPRELAWAFIACGWFMVELFLLAKGETTFAAILALPIAYIIGVKVSTPGIRWFIFKEDIQRPTVTVEECPTPEKAIEKFGLPRLLQAAPIGEVTSFAVANCNFDFLIAAIRNLLQYKLFEREFLNYVSRDILLGTVLDRQTLSETLKQLLAMSKISYLSDISKEALVDYLVGARESDQPSQVLWSDLGQAISRFEEAIKAAHDQAVEEAILGVRSAESAFHIAIRDERFGDLDEIRDARMAASAELQQLDPDKWEELEVSFLQGVMELLGQELMASEGPESLAKVLEYYQGDINCLTELRPSTVQLVARMVAAAKVESLGRQVKQAKGPAQARTLKEALKTAQDELAAADAELDAARQAEGTPVA